MPIQLFKNLSFLVTICGLSLGAPFWHPPANMRLDKSMAHQQSNELLMKEAEENQYTVRNIYFNGNAHTADPVLRRRILMQEGDLFSRPLLYKSLINLSKLKMINLVRLEDVELDLDRTRKVVDFTVTVREKRQSYN